jgi:CTP synthase
LNPAEHGECFVTADGAECDLDLGHYERFLDIELTSASSFMSGRVLRQVIEDERAGKYLGKTVQIIPHVTTEIKEHIKKTADGFDVHIVEIGGTVGDYESLSFIEAIREMAMELGPSNTSFVHVVYLPYLGASGEIKTKPAQNAVRELRGLGIVPDVVVARSENPANPKEIVAKLSMFSGVAQNGIVLMPNARSIYEVPLILQKTEIDEVISAKLNLTCPPADLRQWQSMVKSMLKSYKTTVRVGVVAKYFNNQDTYMSVFEALRAAAAANKVNIEIDWIDAEALEQSRSHRFKPLSRVDGIVVPGGFGRRGGEGKILAAKYALQHQVPYLGLCLGLQTAVIAAARNGGLAKANSTEFDKKTPHPVISTMLVQVGKENTGGSMRLGDWPCVIQKNTLAHKLYNADEIRERHRHRYEASNDYRQFYPAWGIKASGVSPDDQLVEIIEAKSHPFFIAVQSHPEFDSRPGRPHPLFSGFITALAKQARII